MTISQVEISKEKLGIENKLQNMLREKAIAEQNLRTINNIIETEKNMLVILDNEPEKYFTQILNK